MKKVLASIIILIIVSKLVFSEWVVPEIKKYAGMAVIHTKNQSFMMGWDRDEAGTEWACYIGKHQVTFTYDIYMDSTLVTQADYIKLIHINPSAHKTGDLTLPVEKVSWFDALLYCNARSKRDKLDTVYSYTSVTRTDTSVTGLNNLTYNIHKNGYRLPTNAEYEFTERANIKGTYFFADTTQNIDEIGSTYAWSRLNSGNVTQPVAHKKPTQWGLYDLIGNTFEWCSDWEGPYPTTPQTDPIGPPDGKTECGTHWIGSEKRMAKGGSYKTDVKNHMRINYHYKWPPVTASPEIGFRCVATKK